MPQELCDIGLIGLAVMGQNLVLNMNDHGFRVAVFNRTVSKVDDFLKDEAKGTTIAGAHSIEELTALLKRPRRVMLMVKAGETVDHMIDATGPAPGDGRHHHRRRQLALPRYDAPHGNARRKGHPVHRHGRFGRRGGRAPRPVHHARRQPAGMAAREADLPGHRRQGEDGSPCCEWVGENGAGHYVKMVHNGIEYGDMQLICEAYQMLKDGLGLTAAELHDVFAEWNTGELDSYLIEITRDIFGKLDEDGTPLVDKILDTAGQKGTGKWTGISALDLGMPVTLIGEAVFARCLSAMKEERVHAAQVLSGPSRCPIEDRKGFIEDVRRALYCSKMISYAQGYMLLREAAKEYKWNLNFGGIALMWRGGCIIRSRFLGKIKEAFDKNPQLENLLLDEFFSDDVAPAPAGLAQGHRAGDRVRRADARVLDGAGVFRRLPLRAAAGQPAAGAARLLRRAHV